MNWICRSFSFHPQLLLSKSCLSVLLLSSFFLSFCPIRLQASCLLVRLLNSPFLSFSCLSLAYLALEPSSYSHPGSQSLSKGILLFLCLPVLLCGSCISLQCERGASVHNVAQAAALGSETTPEPQTWSLSLLFACRWQQTSDLRSVGLLSATVNSL